jgi:NADPH:quinone reductase-like Zn-dependent oxidoreductase
MNAHRIHKKDRFDIIGCQKTMKAVVTTGNGGYEKLEYRDVPVPQLASGQVLLQVLAAGVNNTEIDTRLGWYSSKVTTSTEALTTGEKEKQEAKTQGDGGWNEATPFPFIQGTDCCGRVIAVTPGGDESFIGSRVLVRSCMRSTGWDSLENIWMASDFDGAFAQFVKVPATEVFPVVCEWSDAELGTIPCAYGTAEHMVHRAKVSKGEHVLIAGASGGVGSAAVQLSKRRGAAVTAIAGRAKLEKVQAIAAVQVIARDEDIVDCLGEKSVDVVVDNVAGPSFGGMLKVLQRDENIRLSSEISSQFLVVNLWMAPNSRYQSENFRRFRKIITSHQILHI